jgi:hypothetical protein
VLALVKSFLRAGVFTETGNHEDSYTGTPQGGILSPLLANIALSVLDEHMHGPWLDGGTIELHADAPDAARRACRLQTHPQSPAELRMVPGDQLVDAAAPLEVDRRSPPTHRP